MQAGACVCACDSYLSHWVSGRVHISARHCDKSILLYNQRLDICKHASVYWRCSLVRWRWRWQIQVYCGTHALIVKLMGRAVAHAPQSSSKDTTLHICGHRGSVSSVQCWQMCCYMQHTTASNAINGSRRVKHTHTHAHKRLIEIYSRIYLQN